MGQQAVAQLQIQRMRIGQHQMRRPLRAMRHQPGGIGGRQDRDLRRKDVRKTVARHIDPGDRKVGQGGQNRHQRPAHMARAPDPKRPARCQHRFHHPPLPKGQVRLAACPARPGQQALHRQRHRTAIDSAGKHTGLRARQGGSLEDFGQKGHRATATLAKGRAQRHAVQGGRAPRQQQTARPCHRVPFQRPAANGACAAVLPDQHRRPRLARGRPVDRCNPHPGNPALRGDGVRQGGQVNHRAASARPSAHARRSRAHPAPDKPIRHHRPPPHPTAPSAPKCPA